MQMILYFSAKNNVLMVNGEMPVATFANAKMKECAIQLMVLALAKVMVSFCYTYSLFKKSTNINQVYVKLCHNIDYRWLDWCFL